MELFAGTSGYSYKEWKGPFYPEKLKAADMLSYYAERLPAVELNNTFYRMPRESVVDAWGEAVPEGFRFSLKASRRITHFKRLKEVEEETGYFLRATERLGARRGVLLFQLPPNMKADRERLERFLELLPAEAPVAFEFRHESWDEPEVVQPLVDRGAAIVAADTEELPVETLPAGPVAYLRLRRPDYSDADLAAWAGRIHDGGYERAFVFFKHEDAGAGPRMAQAFLDAWQAVAEPAPVVGAGARRRHATRGRGKSA